MLSAIFVVISFTAAFSVYELTAKGITQTVLFVKRHFLWDEFKFIGVQRIIGGFVVSGTNSSFIRCSTAVLPKTMDNEQFQRKICWSPTKTITIELPDKNGDEFYREFLSYCGGERDIRE